MKKLTIILTLFIIFNAGCKDDEEICVKCPKYAFLNHKGECECLEGYRMTETEDGLSCDRFRQSIYGVSYYPLKPFDCDCIDDQFKIRITDIGGSVIGNGLEAYTRLPYSSDGLRNLTVHRFLHYDSINTYWPIDKTLCDQKMGTIEIIGIIHRDKPIMDATLNFFSKPYSWFLGVPIDRTTLVRSCSLSFYGTL